MDATAVGLSLPSSARRMCRLARGITRPDIPAIIGFVAEAHKQVTSDALERRNVTGCEELTPSTSAPFPEHAWDGDVLTISAGLDLRRDVAS